MSHSPVSILIAEDNESVRTLLELQLRGLKNATFYEASDGLEALRQIRRQIPDLLITDVSMPNMDGVSLIKEVRADPDPRINQMPIMVITASTDGQASECLHAGADLVLHKPVKSRAVLDAVLILTR